MAAPSTLTGSTETVLTLPKLTTIETVGGILCHICRLTFRYKKDFDAHYLNHCKDKTKIQYTCVACDKTYPGYPTFRNHCYIQHVLKDKFKCPHCAKCFPKVSFLNEHVSAVHHFKCIHKACKKTFTSKAELHHHQLLHKSELNKPPYKCRACLTQILNPDDCEAHIDSHFTMTYFCPICNLEINKKNATNHLTNHFGDNNDTGAAQDDTLQSDSTEAEAIKDSSITIVGGILCCHCNQSFKDKTEINLHFNADHKGKDVVYTCIVCKKQCEKYSLFGDHCYSHCNKNRFECDKCSKSFPRLSVLVNHNETYHETVTANTKKPFPCHHCDRRFHSEKKRQEHIRAKHEDCDWRCMEPGCDQSFETPKDLLLHRKRHYVAHQNWCRTCGMQFDTLASCHKHLDIHKKKLFACPICTKQSNEKYHLMKHIPKHFAAVFHMCKICGMVYNEKRRLLQHTKIHASVKKYLCKYCGKSFAKSSHMSQHINIHTGARPYKCMACPKTFASYPNWNKHLRRMHNIDAKTVKKPEKIHFEANSGQNSSNSGILMQEASLIIDESMGNEFDDDSMDSDSDSTIGGEINAIETFLFNSEADEADIQAVTSNRAQNNVEESVMKIQENLCSTQLIPPTALDTQIIEELLNVGLLPEAPQPIPVDAPPMEYGPDFVNADLTIASEISPGELIQLDDHLLPHIDPLLTIKCDQGPNQTGVGIPIEWDAPYFDILNKSEGVTPNLVWGPTAIEVFSCFNNEMKPVCRSSVM